LAIGDIHGCYTALTSLLGAVGPRPEDRVIFLGDYIDRGEDSMRVIELFLSRVLPLSTVFLRGNHEVMILDSKADPMDAPNWAGVGGFETLLSYGVKDLTDWASKIPPAHWEFLERTKPWFETETHIFVHGGAAPDADMADQRGIFLYWARFEQIRPHKSRKKIICGHTPQLGGVIGDNEFATCIDTGAVFGGWLTCLDVETGQFWQADESGATQVGQLKSSGTKAIPGAS
jgi:serine/threonine protein phosphatase 1